MLSLCQTVHQCTRRLLSHQILRLHSNSNCHLKTNMCQTPYLWLQCLPSSHWRVSLSVWIYATCQGGKGMTKMRFHIPLHYYTNSFNDLFSRTQNKSFWICSSFSKRSGRESLETTCTAISWVRCHSCPAINSPSSEGHLQHRLKPGK